MLTSMRMVIIDGNAVTDRSHGPDITDTIPCFTGQPECFSRLQRQCDGVAFLVVFDQFFQAVSPVFPFATAVGELHKKAAPFSGRILFFSVVCQDGSHTFTGSEFAGGSSSGVSGCCGCALTATFPADDDGAAGCSGVPARGLQLLP